MENEILTRLREQWQQLTVKLPKETEAKENCLQGLIEAYSEPHRFYHTLKHLDAVLKHLHLMQEGKPVSDEVQFAAWYHDVVYNPRASDNEARSADWAVRDLSIMGLNPEAIKSVVQLILATKHTSRDFPDEQTALLLDADLAVLGDSSNEYQDYADEIRREYAFVPEADYRAGRANVLRSFLDRPKIYFTKTMEGDREFSARKNLSAEIERLERPS
ncbi:MAG: hypothetical protein U0798_21050 [Gemmataceae bacterium]